MTGALQDAAARAEALVADVGDVLADGPIARLSQDQPLERLTVPDQAWAERRAGQARAWQAQAQALRDAPFPDDLALDVAVAARTAERLSREDAWWWVVHDPMGLGFYGLYGPTAYCGGWFLGTAAQLVARAPAEGRLGRSRRASLTRDLAACVRAMAERLDGQRARGIVMPTPQLAQARALLPKLARQVREGVAVPGVEDALDAPLRDLERAFQELDASLDGHAAAASGGVGLGALPGGAEIYEALVRLHTTLPLTPEEVHARGRERLAEIREAMAALRGEVGFRGTDAEFRDAVAADPAWHAGTTAEVEAAFRTCLARVRPRLAQWFRFGPAAPHDVAPLPEALTGSMTFGVYQAPAGRGSAGRYLFNAPNLIEGGLATVAALAFHELAPGHHIHLASQYENAALPPARKFNSFNAFNEGWAEYAAALAWEEGLYDTPQARFGRLMMEAFLTSRLVVDTGVNARGWSLERAAAVLREDGFLSAREAESEAVRYSCDMPGQALAYKLGDRFLLDQRNRMRAALGDRFDLRDFHDAVLRPGALPLPLVGRQVDRAIARLAA